MYVMWKNGKMKKTLKLYIKSYDEVIIPNKNHYMNNGNWSAFIKKKIIINEI